MASYTSTEGHQSTTCYRVEGRVDVAAMCLTKGHLRFDPDHDFQSSSSQQQSSGRPQHHFSTSSSNSASIPLNTMQHYTDDLYPLEPLYPQQQQQAQAQQQQQQQYYSQPQVQQWPEYVPVQRQVPSTRAYSYQPYPSSAPSPRVASYSNAGWDYAVLDYPQLAMSYDISPVSVPSLCTDSHSFASHGLYTPQYPFGTSYGLYNQMQMQPQQPTCIAPEDLFARMPMTPISPASLEDSDDRASSPSSAGADTNETPLSTNSSPSRPGLQIPTVPSLSIAPSWTSSTSSNSSLPSPVDSLSSSSSHDDHEPAFVPTASLKKSTAAANNSSLKAKRATRSAAPEPAWVEAVLAEDAKRLQLDVVGLGSNAGAPRPANRPIAFACVFCRHRKIQCIRPKTEVAPGEKPAPCNQCEKRNRCCEYPPAALNPRIGRRTRPAGCLKSED